MSRAFILGMDGQTCWLYSDDQQNGQRLDRAPVSAVADIYSSVADSFELTRRNVESVRAKERLIDEGEEQLDGLHPGQGVCERAQNDKIF